MTRNSLSSDFVTSMPKHSFFTMPRKYIEKNLPELEGERGDKREVLGTVGVSKDFL